MAPAEPTRAELRRANDRLRRRVDEELRLISAERKDDLGRSLLPLASVLMRGLRSSPVTNSGKCSRDRVNVP